MLLAADLNEEIDSKKIDLFMIENRLLDIYIYRFANRISNKDQLDTYKKGSKCINTIAVTTGLLELIAGCRLIEYNEIILLDY